MSTLYAALGTNATTSDLYTLDPATGLMTSDIGPIGFALTGLALNPITGILYGATSNQSAINPRSLISIDQNTGAGTLIGPFNIPNNHPIPDITFVGNTLYGCDTIPATPAVANLYTIDLTTGLATLVGATGAGNSGCGIAADLSGTIYYSGDFADGPLYTLNPITGSGTFVATLNGPEQSIRALAFNISNVLYGIIGNGSLSSVLITIDTTTGQVTTIGTSDLTQIDAIAFSPAACIHRTSIVKTPSGEVPISKLLGGDSVFTADGEIAKIREVVHCWLGFVGVDHDAIIFEPGSLGENEPNKRLIIDPGHPMCTKAEYLEKGYQALRPAGSYWEELRGDKVYTKKWTDIFVQQEPSRRFDLLLEEPYTTYIANGVVVRAKGYKSHTYKRFV